MSNFENYHDNEKPSLPVESNDDAVLRMLSGLIVEGEGQIILPSGKKLVANEAQVFIDAFDDSNGVEPEAGVSIDFQFDKWTGNPEEDRSRFLKSALDAAESVWSESDARAQAEVNQAQLEQKFIPQAPKKRRWWQWGRK